MDKPIREHPMIAEMLLEMETARDSTREGEILTAAARIFREKGYHGTSVRDIAEAVGLLKGSLYAVASVS